MCYIYSRLPRLTRVIVLGRTYQGQEANRRTWTDTPFSSSFGLRVLKGLTALYFFAILLLTVKHAFNCSIIYLYNVSRETFCHNVSRETISGDNKKGVKRYEGVFIPVRSVV